MLFLFDFRLSLVVGVVFAYSTYDTRAGPGVERVTAIEAELIAGRYLFERELGRGGVGSVFLAYDRQLERWVAIKRIHAEPSHSGHRSQAAVSEAKKLASLQHRNIVTVYDFVEHRNEVLVVMEYVQGMTLDRLAAPLLINDFIEFARQSLDGLATAHAMSMVHRDIKASNFMLTNLSGGGAFQVKILDFGLAKVLDIPAPQTIDHTGSLMGSIHMMAPEQFEQRPVDSRTDIYSLGCLFYNVLTKHDAFQGETVAAVMAAHLQHRYVPLAQYRPDVPLPICEWVERMFSWDPDHRPANALKALSELQRILVDLSMDGLAAAVAETRRSVPVEVTPPPPVAEVPAPTAAVAVATPDPEPQGVNADSQSFQPNTKSRLMALLILVVVGLLAAAVWGLAEGKWKLPAGWDSAFKPAAKQTVQIPGTAPVEVKPAPSPVATMAPAASPAAASAPTTAGDLMKSIGQTVTLRGTVSSFGEDQSRIIWYVILKDSSGSDVSLVFFLNRTIPGLSKNVLEALVGKRVEVTGSLAEYQGRLQIEMMSLDQIKTL